MLQPKDRVGVPLLSDGFFVEGSVEGSVGDRARGAVGESVEFGGGADDRVTVTQLEKTFRRLRRAAKSEIYCVRGRESATRLARLLKMSDVAPQAWLGSINRSGKAASQRGTGSSIKQSSKRDGICI